MRFRKVNENKYIGDHGYVLIRCSDDHLCVYKGTHKTEWGSWFSSVKSAENFMTNHDYIKASISDIPLDDSDILFIFDLYGTRILNKSSQDVIFDRWAVNDIYSIKGNWNENCNEGPFKGYDVLSVDLYRNNRPIETFYTAEPLIRRLDQIVDNDIAASCIIRGTELRNIFAANDRRSTREITQNLVRVKSSNVWAYGVEIKDNDAKEGDVYVQFKGKNGGPDSIYVYYSVPLGVWRKILSSPSKGHAVWKYLRNNFFYSKLTGNKRGMLPNAINH